MGNELIKQIVKVGNGAGVILPKDWYGGRAKIELLEKPLDIKKDILEILDSYLNNVLGIYIVGSYARGQQKEHSDVDVLVITSNINKKINKGKYEIILVSKENIENALKKNVLPILPMLKESRAILNKDLISEYAKTPLTKRNMKWHIETTKSAMKVNESFIEDYIKKKKNCGDEISYSLILRLREVYIIDCMIKGKMWGSKEFLNLIKNISGSLIAYEGYLRVKRNLKRKEKLPVSEAEKLKNYIFLKIREHEEWLIKRK